MPLSAARHAQAEAGLPKGKVVAAHGNFDSATCISTGQPVPIEEVREAIMGEDRDGWQRLRDRHGGLVRTPAPPAPPAPPAAAAEAQDAE